MVKLFYMDKEVQRIINSRDLYHVLLVSDDCTDQEILTSAYKSISTKVHPEINKEENAIDAFKRVSHAYQVLTDQKKRNQYSMQLEKEKSTKNKKKSIFQINLSNFIVKKMMNLMEL